MIFHKEADLLPRGNFHLKRSGVLIRNFKKNPVGVCRRGSKTHAVDITRLNTIGDTKTVVLLTEGPFSTVLALPKEEPVCIVCGSTHDDAPRYRTYQTPIFFTHLSRLHVHRPASSIGSS